MDTRELMRVAMSVLVVERKLERVSGHGIMLSWIFPVGEDIGVYRQVMEQDIVGMAEVLPIRLDLRVGRMVEMEDSLLGSDLGYMMGQVSWKEGESLGWGAVEHRLKRGGWI